MRSSFSTVVQPVTAVQGAEKNRPGCLLLSRPQESRDGFAGPEPGIRNGYSPATGRAVFSSASGNKKNKKKCPNSFRLSAKYIPRVTYRVRGPMFFLPVGWRLPAGHRACPQFLEAAEGLTHWVSPTCLQRRPLRASGAQSMLRCFIGLEQTLLSP